MTKSQRYQSVLAYFQEQVPIAETELVYHNPFELLVAVILSAQCTDERVNKITTKLFHRAHTAKQMAALDPKEIEAIIRPCGLAPTKSRANP